MRKNPRNSFSVPSKNQYKPSHKLKTRAIASGLSLVICASALASPTFAWFTQDIQANIIKMMGANFDLKIQNRDGEDLSKAVKLDLSKGDLHKFTITPTGTASSGYCVVKAKDSNDVEQGSWYISPITSGTPVDVVVQAASGTKLTFEPAWGDPPEGSTVIVPITNFSLADADMMISAFVEISSTPYIEYTVPERTNLTVMAGYYGLLGEEVLMYNGIESISEGMTVKIPYVDPSNAPEPYAPPILHTVSAGETITSIAAMYNVSVKALCVMNNLTIESVIGVGQQLTIPVEYKFDTPAPEGPAVETPAGTEDPVTGNKPTVDDPTVDDPVVDDPTVDEPTADDPIVDEPTGDAPVGDKPVGELIISNESISTDPGSSRPTADDPGKDDPAADEPTGDEPVGEEPGADEPTGDEPTGDEPTGDEPTGDEPTGDEPTGDEPTGDEPTGDEPTGDEPTGDEPAGEEPAAGEDPGTDEPTGEEGEGEEEEEQEDEDDDWDIPSYGLNGVPLYFQQDYSHILYGDGTVATSGCSITSLAMVATALTGHEYLPDELADYFGGRAESNMARLELGSEVLQLPYKKSVNWDETWAALQDGKIVIALMEGSSIFTDTQHFIVLTGLNEEGKIIVNDSNRENYDNWQLKKGLRDGFEPKDILYGYSGAWIYDPAAMPEDPFIYSAPRIDRSRNNYPEIELTAEERELLAKVIWVEARGECLEGQQAVAEVIFNRMRSKQFGDTLNDVIFSEGQFRSVPYLDDATPWAAQYQAIDRAFHAERILPRNVVYFASFVTNEKVWGVIGGHVFCYE